MYGTPKDIFCIWSFKRLKNIRIKFKGNISLSVIDQWHIIQRHLNIISMAKQPTGQRVRRLRNYNYTRINLTPQQNKAKQKKCLLDQQACSQSASQSVRPPDRSKGMLRPSDAISGKAIRTDLQYSEICSALLSNATTSSTRFVCGEWCPRPEVISYRFAWLIIPPKWKI